MYYPGGKGLIYQKLINFMPPHEVYLETHLGGGAIIRNKRPAKQNIGIEIDEEVVAKWNKEPVKEVEVISTDAVKYLREYSFTGEELVYSDPPYLRATRRKKARIYKHEYTEEQHIELLEVLKRLPCMVMISSYESQLYKESLKGWQTYSFQSTTHKGVATEWIWMNYPHPIELHDYRYLGSNFRERERIKRKTQRWVSRLKLMPTLERQALLYAIESIKTWNTKSSNLSA